MQHNHKNQYWPSNLDEAITRLASTAVGAREKRAALMVKLADPKPGGTPSLLEQGANYVVDRATNNLKPVLGDATNAAMKHMGWGLAGAGIGGAAGLASQMLAPQKKRRPLSALATGALLGGAAGVGGSMLHSHWDPENLTKKTDADRVAAEAAKQESMKQHQLSGNSNNEIITAGQRSGIAPDRMQQLAEMRRLTNVNGDTSAADSDYITMMRRDRLGFRPPAGVSEQELSTLTPSHKAVLGPYGFSAEDMDKLDPTKSETVSAFKHKILSGNNGQPFMRTSQGQQVPWNKEDLEKIKWDELHGSYHRAKGLYDFDTSPANAGVMKKVLDDISSNVNKSGLGTPTGRMVNDWRTSLDQIENRGKGWNLSGIAGQLPGINQFADQRPRTGGLMSIADQATTGKPLSAASPEYVKAQQLLAGTGLTPTELLAAHRAGPEGINNLAKQLAALKRERVTHFTGAKSPWTEDELKTRLPGLVSGVRKEIGDDTVFTRANDALPSVPFIGDNATAQLGLGSAALDRAGALRAWFRGGNPDQIIDAVNNNKLPASIANHEPTTKLLQYAAKDRNIMTKLMSDPGYLSKRMATMQQALAGDTASQSQLGGHLRGWNQDAIKDEYQAMQSAGVASTTSGGDLSKLHGGMLSKLKADAAATPSFAEFEKQVMNLHKDMAAGKNVGMSAPQLRLLEGEVSRIRGHAPADREIHLNRLIGDGLRDSNGKGIVSGDRLRPLAINTNPTVSLPMHEFSDALKQGLVPNVPPNVQAGLAAMDDASRLKFINDAIANPNKVHALDNGAILTPKTLRALSANGADRGWLRQSFGSGGLGATVSKFPRYSGMLIPGLAGHMLFERGGQVPGSYDELKKQLGK